MPAEVVEGADGLAANGCYHIALPEAAAAEWFVPEDALDADPSRDLFDRDPLLGRVVELNDLEGVGRVFLDRVRLDGRSDGLPLKADLAPGNKARSKAVIRYLPVVGADGNRTSGNDDRIGNRPP